jgi:hypothetical protein
MAERDGVVPARRSEPLRAAVRNLVFERVIDAGSGAAGGVYYSD